MTAQRIHKIVTPAKVRECIDSGMSARRAAEVLSCSESGLRQAASLFGWSFHGQRGPKPNQRDLSPAHQYSANRPFGRAQ